MSCSSAFLLSTIGKMSHQKSHDLAEYWIGIHDALRGRLLSVRESLRHPSSGVNAEKYFRELLADYLPKRYSVDSGFVVNAKGQRSDFMDLLIVDSHNIAPLSAEPYFKVFPAEAVVCAVEITSAPKSEVSRSGITGKIPKLADDILKLARLREIGRHREYLEQVAVDTAAPLLPSDRTLAYELPPRCFLITFGDEWSKTETFERRVRECLNLASRHSRDVWINAVWSMRHGMMHFRPHTNFESTTVMENSLLEFVLFINRAASEFRTARIDVRRYRPTAFSASE